MSLKDQIDHSLPTPQQAGTIINYALKKWRSFSDPQRVAAINVLFLHTRTHAYEIEAERFSSEYQILDGVYAILHPNKKGRHGERIENLCKELDIRFEDAEKDWTEKLVLLRNKLLHETIWDGGMPGEARSLFSFYASLRLHQLTKRAMLASLGINGSYIRSSWSTLSSWSFNIDP